MECGTIAIPGRLRSGPLTHHLILSLLKQPRLWLCGNGMLAGAVTVARPWAGSTSLQLISNDYLTGALDR